MLILNLVNTRTIAVIEIEPRIRRSEALNQAVIQASDFLEAQADDVPPPGCIRWRLADQDGKLLQLSLLGSFDPSGPKVEHNVWTRWILDPASRKLCMLQAWSELLSKRSDRNIQRIRELSARLREEEADAIENVVTDR